eukprot:3995693-Amphidinium_carterae.3
MGGGMTVLASEPRAREHAMDILSLSSVVQCCCGVVVRSPCGRSDRFRRGTMVMVVAVEYCGGWIFAYEGHESPVATDGGLMVDVFFDEQADLAGGSEASPVRHGQGIVRNETERTGCVG